MSYTSKEYYPTQQITESRKGLPLAGENMRREGGVLAIDKLESISVIIVQ